MKVSADNKTIEFILGNVEDLRILADFKKFFGKIKEARLLEDELKILQSKTMGELEVWVKRNHPEFSDKALIFDHEKNCIKIENPPPNLMGGLMDFLQRMGE